MAAPHAAWLRMASFQGVVLPASQQQQQRLQLVSSAAHPQQSAEPSTDRHASAHHSHQARAKDATRHSKHRTRTHRTHARRCSCSGDAAERDATRIDRGNAGHAAAAARVSAASGSAGSASASPSASALTSSASAQGRMRGARAQAQAQAQSQSASHASHASHASPGAVRHRTSQHRDRSGKHRCSHRSSKHRSSSKQRRSGHRNGKHRRRRRGHRTPASAASAASSASSHPGVLRPTNPAMLAWREHEGVPLFFEYTGCDQANVHFESLAAKDAPQYVVRSAGRGARGARGARAHDQPPRYWSKHSARALMRRARAAKQPHATQPSHRARRRPAAFHGEFVACSSGADDEQTSSGASTDARGTASVLAGRAPPDGIAPAGAASKAQAREREFARQNELCQSAVQRNPRDVSAWLAYVAHQDVLGSMIVADDAAAGATSTAAQAIGEKKLAILERALAANPTSLPLAEAMLTVAELVRPPSELAALWRVMLAAQPHEFELWRRYVRFCKYGYFEAFSCAAVRDVYAAAVRRLVEARDGAGTSARRAALESDIVRMLLDAVRFELVSGFSERAIAMLQALCEFNLFAPHVLAATSGDAVDAFARFWNSEVPRMGDIGARGWCYWHALFATGAASELDLVRAQLADVEIAELVPADASCTPDTSCTNGVFDEQPREPYEPPVPSIARAGDAGGSDAAAMQDRDDERSPAAALRRALASERSAESRFFWPHRPLALGGPLAGPVNAVVGRELDAHERTPSACDLRRVVLFEDIAPFVVSIGAPQQLELLARELLQLAGAHVPLGWFAAEAAPVALDAADAAWTDGDASALPARTIGLLETSPGAWLATSALDEVIAAQSHDEPRTSSLAICRMLDAFVARLPASVGLRRARLHASYCRRAGPASLADARAVARALLTPAPEWLALWVCFAELEAAYGTMKEAQRIFAATHARAAELADPAACALVARPYVETLLLLREASAADDDASVQSVAPRRLLRVLAAVVLGASCAGDGGETDVGWTSTMHLRARKRYRDVFNELSLGVLARESADLLGYGEFVCCYALFEFFSITSASGERLGAAASVIHSGLQCMRDLLEQPIAADGHTGADAARARAMIARMLAKLIYAESHWGRTRVRVKTLRAHAHALAVAQPCDALPLALYVWLEATSLVALGLRMFFSHACVAGAPTLVWLHAIHAELARGGPGCAMRVRAVLERAVRLNGAPVLWRTYVLFSLAHSELATAAPVRIVTRAIAAVPACKRLWLDAIGWLSERGLLRPADVRAQLALAAAKDLRLRELVPDVC